MRYGLVMAVVLGVMLPWQSALALPVFQWPVDCEPGQECFIQNHFDHAPEKDIFRDYHCGALGYDGHTGTDIRVRNLRALQGEGVDILAAADGRVLRLIGQGFSPPPKEQLSVLDFIQQGILQRGCGVGVILEHETGWTTHYCHLRLGSISVEEGEWVKAGMVLGKMGMTGRTVFPHLHFGVRQYNQDIDPFVGYRSRGACDVKRRPLWAEELLPKLTYQPTGVVEAGFTVHSPDVMTTRQTGALPLTALEANQSMGVWLEAFGLQAEDVVTIDLTAPDGSVLAQQQWQQPQHAALRHFSLTVPPPHQGWPAGGYHARFTLQRAAERPLTYQWHTVLQ